MYEFVKRIVKQYSGNKEKTDFYSQLFIVTAVKAESTPNSVRKFNELCKFMKFFVGKFPLATTPSLVGNDFAQLCSG